jgi:hypothetical protein
VGTDQDKKHLELVIHWKGGAHTQLAMERPRSAAETATPMEALDSSLKNVKQNDSNNEVAETKRLQQ